MHWLADIGRAVMDEPGTLIGTGAISAALTAFAIKALGYFSKHIDDFFGNPRRHQRGPDKCPLPSTTMTIRGILTEVPGDFQERVKQLEERSKENRDHIQNLYTTIDNKTSGMLKLLYEMRGQITGRRHERGDDQ